jgi:hypothetical protein
MADVSAAEATAEIEAARRLVAKVMELLAS